MRLYFARHGESEANVLRIISNRGLPHGLTEKGQQQAFALAHSIKDVPIAAIFASPILRARQTADILADELGLSYQVADALREYDCGVLEGHSDEESWEQYREIANDWIANKNWQRKPDQGESFLDIQNRFLPFIMELVQAELDESQNIILIGHGGLFRMMLPLLLSNIDHQFINEYGIDHTAWIIAEPQEGGWQCIQWGSISFDHA